jgi:hypothetical protein
VLVAEVWPALVEWAVTPVTRLARPTARHDVAVLHAMAAVCFTATGVTAWVKVAPAFVLKRATDCPTGLWKAAVHAVAVPQETASSGPAPTGTPRRVHVGHRPTS